jgi:axial budding pattern protein 2
MVHDKSSAAGPVPVPRMLARMGEQFRFRISLSLPITSTAPLEVRLMDTGSKLPRFLKVDLAATTSSSAEKRVVEFSGVPTKADVGELEVGVYERGRTECVGRIVIEIIKATQK